MEETRMGFFEAVKTCLNCKMNIRFGRDMVLAEPVASPCLLTATALFLPFTPQPKRWSGYCRRSCNS